MRFSSIWLSPRSLTGRRALLRISKRISTALSAPRNFAGPPRSFAGRRAVTTGGPPCTSPRGTRCRLFAGRPAAVRGKWHTSWLLARHCLRSWPLVPAAGTRVFPAVTLAFHPAYQGRKEPNRRTAQLLE